MAGHYMEGQYNQPSQPQQRCYQTNDGYSNGYDGGGRRPIGYTVTHLFTGLAIRKKLSNREARMVAETLPLIDDWYFSVFDMADYTSQRGSKALNKRIAKSRKWLRETFNA